MIQPVEQVRRRYFSTLPAPAREVEPNRLGEVETPAGISGAPAVGPWALSRRPLRTRAPACRRRTLSNGEPTSPCVPEADGMAEPPASLPRPVAMTSRDTLDGYARTAEAGADSRTIGRLQVGGLCDPISRR